MEKCNFTIESTEPIEKLIEKAKNAITNNGGTFSGDTEKGHYSIQTPLGGISGNYAVQNSAIAFEITDKPFLLGCGKIEVELRKYLRT